MTNDVRDTPKSSTAVVCFRIAVLFFALGGIGAAWGTQMMMLMKEGATTVDAGWAYLLAGLCLALPGSLILRHAGNKGGW